MNAIIRRKRRSCNEQNNFYEYSCSEEEIDKLKRAARLEIYVSYSEFIRRTALKEADKIIRKK